MIINLSQLKAWFSKGRYPTESQFHNWLDSFWHKTDDKIPIVAVENLPEEILRLNELYLEYTVFQFAKNTSTSVAPTSNWSNTPPTTSNTEYLWLRSGVVVTPNTEPLVWSSPVRITGESTYQIAARNGYKGTEAEWLASLKGEKGSTPEITASINNKGDLLIEITK